MSSSLGIACWPFIRSPDDEDPIDDEDDDEVMDERADAMEAVEMLLKLRTTSLPSMANTDDDGVDDTDERSFIEAGYELMKNL